MIIGVAFSIFKILRAGDGDGRYSGGFGPEDSWAEGYGVPVVGREEGHLFVSPAAFGADGQGYIRISICELEFCEGRGNGVGLFRLGEEDAGGAGFLFEGGLQRGGVGDLGDGRAAGLLGGLKGDATPSLGSFGSGLNEVFVGSAGGDGGDAGDAEFGGFLDGPLHVIELEDGEEKVEGKGGVGLELFVEGEDDLGILSGATGADGSDFGAVEEASGDYVVDLPGGSAEDSGEVGSLVSGEGGGFRGPGVGDPAAAGHAYSLLYL